MSAVLRAGLVLAAAAALTIGAASATGEVIRLGNVEINVDGGFKPKKLPEKRFAPIALNVEGQVETLDDTTPPILERIVVDFDRNGRPFSKGIRNCRQRQLEARTTEEVRSRQVCGRSRVGSGVNDILVTFPDSRPIVGRAKLTAFKTNGGNLLFHARLTDPIVTTVVAKGRITNSPLRGFRTRVITRIPEIADGDGRLVSFDLTIGGKQADTWRHRGKRRKFATARCANGRLTARGKLEFESGEQIEGALTRPCKARR